MAKVVEAYVTGLNDVLRSLRALPKEATTELRLASVVIADRHMVPAWKDAATSDGGPWGERIAASVRAKRDRIPAVSIGYAKRVYSGGASTVMTRRPSSSGTRGRAGKRATQFGDGTDWMDKVRPYQPAALREWAQAVDRIVRKWDTTP
jgi:hypothetical protein